MTNTKQISKTTMNKLVKSYIYAILKNIEVDHEVFIVDLTDPIQQNNYDLFSTTLEYQLNRICNKLESEEKDITYNASLFSLIEHFKDSNEK